MWIFGYGSLMWKTDFPYEERLTGFIKGYVRRFWQGSEDHRGVPGQPGRVVTLVKSTDPEESVCGVAYKISPADIENVEANLNYREKDGYEKQAVIFYSQSTTVPPFELIIYVGDESNPFYLGPAPLEDIANQISKAQGPSGRNDDYLFQLANTLRNLFPQDHDSHVFELESLVKAFEIEYQLL